MEQTIRFCDLDRSLGNHAPFLVALSDGLSETLRLVLAPAMLGGPAGAVPDLENADAEARQAIRDVLADARPIEPDMKHLYEISFDACANYQVRNEACLPPGRAEVRRGRFLCLLEGSRLLEYLNGRAYVQEDWQHYEICTQNHIIDVAACGPPAIRCLCPPFPGKTLELWDSLC